jgi:hypothetical protein
VAFVGSRSGVTVVVVEIFYLLYYTAEFGHSLF